MSMYYKCCLSFITFTLTFIINVMCLVDLEVLSRNKLLIRVNESHASRPLRCLQVYVTRQFQCLSYDSVCNRIGVQLDTSLKKAFSRTVKYCNGKSAPNTFIFHHFCTMSTSIYFLLQIVHWATWYTPRPKHLGTKCFTPFGAEKIYWVSGMLP